MKTYLLVIGVLLASPSAHSWSRRGHAVLCETAAQLLRGGSQVFQSRSYDLGYYCNVPDLIWKKGDLYRIEWTQHFMDLEIFERAFRSRKVDHPFALDRLEFEKKFPEIPQDAGRAFWRIRELEARLAQTTRDLVATDLDHGKKFELQLDWLITAGAIGHYVGDLSQPLHVTENFDGQLTKQAGFHFWFEDEMTDLLFQDKPFSEEVLRRARKIAPPPSSRSTLELLERLAEDSSRAVNTILRRDQKIGRSSLERAAFANREDILDQLARGAVVLAEIWRRQGRWKFELKKFYNFEGAPPYIAPPRAD